MSTSPRHRVRWTALGLLAGVLAMEGCRTPAPAASPAPPWMDGPVAAASAPPAPAPILAVDGSTVAPGEAIFDPATVLAVLDEPQMAVVRAHIRREAFKGAADELAGLLREAPPPDPVDEARWTYQLGRLRIRAGDPQNAARAFERAAAVDWPLAARARLEAARLLVALGSPDEGLAHLDAIDAPSLAGAVQLARARAHREKREVDRAVALWRAYAGTDPRPDDWDEVLLDAVGALLNQPSEARAELAVELSRQVIRGSSHRRHVALARDAERDALETLPHDRRQKLVGTLAVRVDRARGMAWSHQGRDALKEADVILKALEAEPSPTLACEAHLTKGKALEVLDRHQEASDALEEAIDRCAGQPRQVVALFLGGRAALHGGKISLARKRYAQLEQSFPDHRYADDARMHGAEAAKRLGDVATYTRMIGSIAEAYPDGDMVEPALFDLALDRIEADDWGGALRPLETAAKLTADDVPYWRDGRAAYFLGRARLELGQTEEGLAQLERVIEQHPLTYYMLQAHRRLAHHDPARAQRVLTAVQEREPAGGFVIPDHAELHRPGFLAAVELVRVGDGAAALHELEALGVRSLDVHPSLLWASAFLLSRIDAASESHGLLRGARGFRDHYPAGVWRPLWEVAYPRPFADVVQKEVARSPISPSLAYAIMREESAFMPAVVSHAGAYGLMQLIEPTAKMVARKLGLPATKAALKTPAVNVALGCRFLHDLQRRFGTLPVMAIPGYNAGPGNPRKWIDARPADDFDVWVENIPYRETRRYTKRVLQSMAAYAMLYGEGMDDPLLKLPLTVEE